MKKFTLALVALMLLANISWAGTGTPDPPKAAAPQKGNIIGRAWKTMNPYYNSSWNPWQKFVYWIGPGH